VAKGDHIYINCGAYTHHGIDCGNGTAIHYIGESLKGIITRTSMESFTSGKKVFTRKYRIYAQPEIVIQRAERRLGEDKYDLLFNNCEHFATWCKTGEHESDQVNRVAAVTGGTVGIGVSVGGFRAMNTVSATFVISEEIAEGLRNGTLERVGGTIRDPQTKQVVAWLRETAPNVSPVSKILQIGAAASVLNLGVTMMGFAIVNQRLNELEQRLQQAQELLNRINRKIDLGFYANFRAALDLAVSAMKMKNPETRKGMAIQAISKLKEADYIYTDYTDKELDQGSQIADEYLLTLSLAYVAEARCYLELEAPDAALDRLQEGGAKLRPRIQRYINLLLTSNPAAYLQPQYKEQIDLRRLTRIYQWTDPTLDENAVFELQRENFVKFVQDPNKWVESLPSAILDRVEVAGWGWFGPKPDDLKQEAIKRLPQVLEVIESMIETNCRFEAYRAEVQAIAQLGISFHEWLQLAPSEQVKPDGTELMYIIPDKPIEV
jgi:hypothetical protein